jgi:hypothetical protein
MTMLMIVNISLLTPLMLLPPLLFLGLALFMILKRRKANVLFALTAGALLVCALFIAISLALGLDASSKFKVAAWVLMVVVCALLIACALWLIWKFFGWLGQADPAGGSVNPEERQRIIAMVEQNRMTPQEGTELLDALGKSSALRGQQTFSRLDMLILLGLAATIMGFFLPWKWLNMYDGATGLRFYQNGYQVGVIGGIIIGCSIIAAILVFITPKDYLYKLLLMQVMWICLGLALIASIWLGAGRYVGYGAIICVAGYGVALVGSVMKLRALGR